MAYLGRNRLPLNKGQEAPSKFNRPRNTTYDPVDANIKKRVTQIMMDEDDIEPQPIGHIRKVKRVISLAPTSKHHHLVELECGHVIHTTSTFQGFCTKCQEH